jgi:hypothetical protein
MNIFVASGHRTGSTHLCNSLGRIIGYKVVSGIPSLPGGIGADEHMVNPFAAQCLFPICDKLIYHQHTKGTRGNFNQLNIYAVKIIVTVRNIYDVVVSVKDRMNKGLYVPCIPTPEPWLKVPDHQKWQFLVYNLVPWTLQFYASWKMANVQAYWVKYSDFYEDQVKGMRGVLEWLGLSEGYPDDIILESVKQHEDEFFMGIQGRGKSMPDWAKKECVKQTEAWGDLGKQMREDLF